MATIVRPRVALALAALLWAQTGEAQVRSFVLGDGARPGVEGGNGLQPLILTGRFNRARLDTVVARCIRL